ncbi:helix-turn-helix domain-containing protein [bacterium BS0013]
MMDPTQCRMARAALGWTALELAHAAMVGVATVNRFEAGQSKPNRVTIAALQAALEHGGAVFLEAGEMKDGGPGVRLRNS